MGAPLHAESQGQVERQNQLIANLRCMCENDVRLWPNRIYDLQFSHNSSQNAATGYSPFELLFARPARRPESAIGSVDEPETAIAARRSPADEVAERRRVLDGMHQQAQVSVERTQKARIARTTSRARGQPFELGDLVRLHLTVAERGRLGGKLSPVLSPLYRVVQVLRDGWTYRVARVQGTGRRKNDVKIRHYNDLTRSTADTGTRWLREESGSEMAPSSATDTETESTASSEDTHSEENESEDGDEEERKAAVRPQRIREAPDRLVVDPRRKTYESRKLSGGV